MSVLFAISLTTGILSGLWGWLSVSLGLLTWAGFLGCTSYFASPKDDIKGLARSMIANLSGVFWAMVIIHGSSLISLEIFGYVVVPERFVKVWNNWLENIRDWCISRQLWWGHRIPAWHCADCQHITVAREDPDKCEACGNTNIRQDPDALDTWFSSGLFPFSTLG